MKMKSILGLLSNSFSGFLVVVNIVASTVSLCWIDLLWKIGIKICDYHEHYRELEVSGIEKRFSSN